MAQRPVAPDDPRAVLRLARDDRRAAVEALRATGAGARDARLGR